MKAEKGKEAGTWCPERGLRHLAAWWLLLSLVACGAPVSEKAPGAAVSGSGGATASQNLRGAPSSSQPDVDADERENRSIPGVPDRVIRDLGSADPRERSRALEHWNVKGGTTPLDPVFEAMDDEDEAVRAKAESIIEKRWAEEHENNKG